MPPREPTNLISIARGLLERLDNEADAAGMSMTALVSTLLDEGLKTRRFPGIVYRDGPTGRRAALAGGPDVWEIIRAIKLASGKTERRVAELADQLGLPGDRLRLAIDFYTAFPEEIQERIAADEAAAARVREIIERRDQLMSG